MNLYRKNSIFPLSCLCFVLLALSCKKEKKTNNEITYTNVLFSNTISEELNLRIYNSLQDYYNNANIIQKGVIPANGQLQMPNMQVGKTYYLEWYSDDYTYSNWYNYYRKTDSSTITPTLIGNDTFTINLQNTIHCFNRLLSLNDSGTSSTWKAIGGVSNFVVDPWDSLTENERYRVLVLRKDFSATYYHKDGLGNIIADSLIQYTYKNTPDSEGVLMLHNLSRPSIAGTDEIDYMPGYSLPIGSGYMTKDTVFAILDSSVFFIMARQK